MKDRTRAGTFFCITHWEEVLRWQFETSRGRRSTPSVNVPIWQGKNTPLQLEVASFSAAHAQRCSYDPATNRFVCSVRYFVEKAKVMNILSLCYVLIITSQMQDIDQQQGGHNTRQKFCCHLAVLVVEVFAAVPPDYRAAPVLRLWDFSVHPQHSVMNNVYANFPGNGTPVTAIKIAYRETGHILDGLMVSFCLLRSHRDCFMAI